MALATYRLWVDWLNTGTFAGPNDNISAYLQESEVFHGRDFPSQIAGRPIAGSGTFRLNNETGIFNSFLASSPLFPNVLPRRRVKLEMIISSTVAIYSGFVQEIEPLIELGGGHKAIMRTIGALAVLNAVDVQLPTSTSIASGTAITAILDEAGWPAADRVIDAGETTFERWPLYRGPVNALRAVRDVETSEPGLFRETKDGKLAFESRHHRLKSPHTSAVATFSDTEGSKIGYARPRQMDLLKEVYNHVTVTVRDWTVGGLAVLWTLQQEPLIAAGESLTLIAEYPNPQSASDAVMVDAWTTPVATTDYLANSQSGGGGSDLTGDVGVAVTKYAFSMEITLTNTGTQDAYITLLQARGTPVTENDTVSLAQEDATSIASYGRRTFPIPGPFIPFSVAQDYARHIVSIRKNPVPILAVEFNANRTSELLEQAQLRDVSDRVAISAVAATKLGISEDFFIESIRHRIDHRSGEHYVIFEVCPASGYSGFWVLGVSQLGISNRLAY